MTNTTVCTHSQSGRCLDDATQEQRNAFEAIHRHGYDWALERGLARQDAEDYATLEAAECYTLPNSEWGTHSLKHFPVLAAKYPHVS